MNYENRNNGFRARLEELIGLEKPFPWANRIGLSPGVFNRMWNDSVMPKGEHLVLIADKTGCSLDWLVLGKGSKNPRTGVYTPPESLSTANSALKIDDGFVKIPRYEVVASAGGGAVIHSEQIVDHLSFKADWVRNALGVQVSSLALINVTGDSMEPALSDGDLILIDLSSNHIKDNAIYVLKLNGSLLVKRIQRKLDGSIIVKSDNTVYEPETIPFESINTLNVIGRVVWCGRRM